MEVGNNRYFPHAHQIPHQIWQNRIKKEQLVARTYCPYRHPHCTVSTRHAASRLPERPLTARPTYLKAPPCQLPVNVRPLTARPAITAPPLPPLASMPPLSSFPPGAPQSPRSPRAQSPRRPNSRNGAFSQFMNDATRYSNMTYVPAVRHRPM